MPAKHYKFTKTEQRIIIWVSILCGVIRILGGGWTLIAGIFILAPYYVLHYVGQVGELLVPTISKREGYLVFISTALLVLVTVLQTDCDDQHCFYVIDRFTHLLPQPAKGLDFSIPVQSIFVIDSVLNIFLIVRRVIVKSK
jgi:hypothetical protein